MHNGLFVLQSSMHTCISEKPYEYEAVFGNFQRNALELNTHTAITRMLPAILSFQNKADKTCFPLIQESIM